jgi:hypothetical protein
MEWGAAAGVPLHAHSEGLRTRPARTGFVRTYSRAA